MQMNEVKSQATCKLSGQNILETFWKQTNRQTKPIIHLKNQINIRQDNVHPMTVEDRTG